MIKFIPDAVVIPGEMTLNNAVDRITRQGQVLVSKQLAEKMNTHMGHQSCEFHPDFVNEVFVDLTNKERPFRVHSYCCDAFHEKLKAVEENKNPFS